MEEDGGLGPAPARAFPPPRRRQHSRALERGLAILACFTPARPELGVSELARLAGMSAATTYRHASTLVGLGALEQEASSRRYRLGFGVLDLGMAALSEMGLAQNARPYLEELAEHSGYTVALAVLDGPEILVIDRVSGTRRGGSAAQDEPHLGSHLPTYCTSLGKVLLAHLPDEQLEELVSELDLVEHGPGTITSRQALRNQLEDVRQAGLAINQEELVAASCAIAAPVRDESGDVVAAVSVVAYNGSTEPAELIDRFAGRLEASAQRISIRLGWADAQS
jgi:IclR family pca regulon transcriptional regulator